MAIFVLVVTIFVIIIQTWIFFSHWMDGSYAKKNILKAYSEQNPTRELTASELKIFNKTERFVLLKKKNILSYSVYEISGDLTHKIYAMESGDLTKDFIGDLEVYFSLDAGDFVQQENNKAEVIFFKNYAYIISLNDYNLEGGFKRSPDYNAEIL